MIKQVETFSKYIECLTLLSVGVPWVSCETIPRLTQGQEVSAK